MSQVNDATRSALDVFLPRICYALTAYRQSWTGVFVFGYSSCVILSKLKGDPYAA